MPVQAGKWSTHKVLSDSQCQVYAGGLRRISSGLAHTGHPYLVGSCSFYDLYPKIHHALWHFFVLNITKPNLNIDFFIF